jgi:SAM-dependent methyltransferase
MPDHSQHLYDEVPYPSFPLAQTHPDRLATLATLFGMRPAAVESCKVLELGCGDGSNLIPMAVELPNAAILGVDLAAQTVARGQAIIDELGLKNVTLRVADVMDVTLEWGQFDYIIAHGLYCWVPPAVRERIMEICRANLAPQGVAYISYNTLPGCHARRMKREMMQFHVRGVKDPRQKITQAVAFLQFLAAGQTRPDWFSAFLESEMEDLQEPVFANLLFHDDLAEINDPLYFHQFVQHAGQHALQFLAEADYDEMQYSMYPPAVAEQLRQMARQNILLKEQYLDFLKCRRFRQTLLCHRDVALNREPGPEMAARFYINAPAKATSPTPNLAAEALEEFQGPRGAALRTDHPVSKAALLILGEIWPRTLGFWELLDAARQRLGVGPGPANRAEDPDALALAEILLGAFSAALAEFHVYQPPWVDRVSERPCASPLARRQAAHGEMLVADLRHTSVALADDFERDLLTGLDGSRDRAALAALGPRLEPTLQKFARSALLRS